MFGKFESETQKIRIQKAKVYGIIFSEVFPFSTFHSPENPQHRTDS